MVDAELYARFTSIEERTIESAMSRDGMITRPGLRTNRALVDGDDNPFKLLAYWGMLQLAKHLQARGSSLAEWSQT